MIKGKIKLCFALVCLSINTVGISSEADPVEQLREQEPNLYALYSTYPTYINNLSKYAVAQGFNLEYEKLATVIHELIHIDSYIHQGFYIDGVYYDPYLQPTAWPALTNKEILQNLDVTQETSVTFIAQNYLNVTPTNTMANVVDEINAYSHVLQFVCRNEPDSCKKQQRNMSGFIEISKRYALETNIRRDSSAFKVYAFILDRANQVLHDSYSIRF